MSLKDAGQLLIQTGLLDKAEKIWKTKLAAEPNHIKALESLALIYRKKGMLLASADLYERLNQIKPEHPTASYIQAILRQKRPDHTLAEDSDRPAPFLYLNNFLSEQQHASLFELVRKHQSQFDAGTVGQGILDTELRYQLTLTHPDIRTMMAPAIGQALAHALDLFQFDSLKPAEASIDYLHVALTHHDQYGRPHQDQEDGRYKVSCVYYFFEEPKAFTGGNLLLYDTNTFTDKTYGQFSQIEIQNNSLIIYPSNYYHQITRVSCPDAAFHQGRFAIAGHIHFD